MNLLSTIGKFIGGDFVEKTFDTVTKYFPPSMSDSDKHAAKLALMQLEAQRELAANDAMHQAQSQLTAQISQLEGSARDLLQMPVLGRLIIFLRGCQRPLWGYACLYLDYQWFTQWTLSDKQESALWLINLLVLGFLFGERAVKNCAPLLEKMFIARGAK